ncbi:WD40 repeat-like protein [Suhomyces tanzawaensis NRRL Y-17324]|uniref:WD40 repeat-like protein n=1 Tax=Suhomyces tanzawaensis NRRL Y-17324 TaxID=984487 RepID=A0A1E4SGH9_9ASCO|nr:WD40 repeat-like protein [Suhomyces tanzawaensis NRRL Y-17324]ODV78608.1 WD40 repeat-like protein [Suhomyces tanzawaensis NRRL Y-17324]
MSQDKISAFLDGNSLVWYHEDSKNLIIGNSEGLLKIFNVNEPDLEPVSIDINENLTALAAHGNTLALTCTSGNLEQVSLETNQSKGSVYRSELPLRDVIFINEGKRILSGGDDNKLVILDVETQSNPNIISLPDQLLNLSYNHTGEILALSLANGNIQLYSVINEVPSLIHTINNALPTKIHTSLEKIDYNDEHRDELVSTKTLWSSNGTHLVLPSSNNTIKVYDRSDWSETKEFTIEGSIWDFALVEPFLVVLKENRVQVLDYTSKRIVADKSFDLEGNLALNVAVNEGDVYIGTSGGEVISFKGLLERSSEPQPSKSNGISSLFLDEAEEDSNDEAEDTDALLRDSDDEPEPKRPNENGYRLHQEDSMVIDEEEEDFTERRKRHKPNGFIPPRHIPTQVPVEDLKPYSPGSTPWGGLENNQSSSTDRRYLFMNSIGYVWAVKNIADSESTNQQSITVSFFDRSVHKDYHFVDYFQYDLCSINDKGTLLAYSGHKDKKSTDNAKIYYRNHDSEQESWERKIPLLKEEYLTSVSITSSAQSTGDATIVVGTNFGYLRFFNHYGVCINIMKTTPVVSLISSSASVLFAINQLTNGVYTYSIIDVNLDYKYIQQDVLLPLKKPTNQDIPLIKGTFFNEFNDPCLVGGADDTLLVLQAWREPGNSKWTPLMNCHSIVTEDGNNSNKKNWKCWPLGLYKDQLSCLILKNNKQYPAFPLPLPIELEIKLPIQIREKSQKNPEEIFLRSLTMGKLVSEALNDDNHNEEQDEIMERLTQYSMMFDRSLLKMFGEACKETRLNKALSIAKMIKTDKALAAAAKISERMQFMTLATKIGKLREELVSLSDEEE